MLELIGVSKMYQRSTALHPTDLAVPDGQTMVTDWFNMNLGTPYASVAPCITVASSFARPGLHLSVSKATIGRTGIRPESCP